MSQTIEIRPSDKDATIISKLPTGVIKPNGELEADTLTGSFLIDYPLWVEHHKAEHETRLGSHWAEKFDDDTLALLEALLILQKRITLRMRETDELPWYGRFVDEIEGRSDSDKISIYHCRLPNTVKSIGQVATSRTTSAQEKGQAAA